MAPLKRLFREGRAGFTVYSPDCAQSRFWGNLDHAIHRETGFQVAYRMWIIHDVNSASRFYAGPDEETPTAQDPEEAARKYDRVPPEDLQPGHMVMKMFLSGPSLLTIWRGEQVVETLLALKGLTHPAEAGPNTLRGRFWCDNAVCNLVHVSDDYAEAERELRAIDAAHLLDEEFGQLDLIDPVPAPGNYVAHSGITIVCDLMRRLHMTAPGTEIPAVELPPSGDAKETNQELTRYLQRAAANAPGSPAAEFVAAFLTGDLVAVTRMLKTMPITKWEHFIVQCSTLTRAKWNAPP